MLSAIDGVATPIWLRRPSFISLSSATRNLILADQRIFAVLQHILLLERPRAGVGDGKALVGDRRSDERRVGKACVSTCRSRWSPYQSNKKHKNTRLHIQLYTNTETNNH